MLHVTWCMFELKLKTIKIGRYGAQNFRNDFKNTKIIVKSSENQSRAHEAHFQPWKSKKYHRKISIIAIFKRYGHYISHFQTIRDIFSTNSTNFKQLRKMLHLTWCMFVWNKNSPKLVDMGLKIFVMTSQMRKS